MTPDDLQDQLRKANDEARDKRSEEAIKLLAIAIGIPFLVFFLCAVFGG